MGRCASFEEWATSRIEQLEEKVEELKKLHHTHVGIEDSVEDAHKRIDTLEKVRKEMGIKDVKLSKEEKAWWDKNKDRIQKDITEDMEKKGVSLR